VTSTLKVKNITQDDFQDYFTCILHFEQDKPKEVSKGNAMILKMKGNWKLYGAGTSFRTSPVFERIPKNTLKKEDLAKNLHTS